MADYNLTNQKISSSFQQVMQHDKDTSLVYDGTGSLITNLNVTSSEATHALTASYADNVDDPTWDSIQNKPNGIVSGSSQVDYPNISNIPSGIVSSSAQITDGSGIVSGSYVSSIIAGTNIIIDQSDGDVTIQATTTASADWGSITSKPAGLVSGSSQIILQDTTGDLSGSRIDGQVALAAHSDTTQEVVINVKNTSGGVIAKGTPLYATGVTGENINVSPADNTSSSTMPAIAVAQVQLSDNGVGEATVIGKIIGVNTGTFAAGQNIYVGTGNFTQTKPTGTALIQNIGVVGKVDGTDGEVVIQGSGRSNDLPNLLDGYAWVGDINGVPQAVSTGSFGGTTIDTGSFATTGSNLFTGDQTIDASLIVSQSAGVTGSIIHFPVLSSQGDQGTAASRFYNPGGPSLFETSISGVDKFELQTVGLAEMQINSGTSMVLNAGTSGNGNLVSTKIMVQQDSAISGNGQKDSITIGSYTGANGTVYNTNIWGTQNYPGSGINNAFIIGKYNSNFQKVSELMVNEGQVQMQLGTGADTDYDKILLNDNNNGTSTILLKADSISTNQPVTQTFPAPGTNGESQFVNVGNVDVSGVQYPIARQIFADFPGSGQNYENYFGTEVYGTGYAYGSEHTVNGKGIFSQVIPSGSGGAGNASFVRISDNYNGTSNIEIGAPTGVINIPTHINFNGRITSGLQGASISNSTASLQMQGPQMAVVDLPSSGDTHFELVAPNDGQVFNVLVKQGGSGTVSLPSNVKQPSGNAYTASSGAGSRDILTFATYDTNTTNEIYLVNVNNLT